MKTRSVRLETMFLQAVVVLIGIAALGFLLWEPHLEGRNANATTFEIYFTDPFVAYAYVASVSFFVALYQAFKLLSFVGTNEILSQAAFEALRAIRICFIAIIGFAVLGEIVILPNADELPPPIFMGFLIIFGSTVMAASTSVFEHILRKAIGTSSENSPSR